MTRRASLQEEEEGQPFLPLSTVRGRSGAVAAYRQGESPRQDPARPAPRPRTSSPQKPGGELCRLSQPAVVFSLQQRALPKTTLSSKQAKSGPWAVVS